MINILLITLACAQASKLTLEGRQIYTTHCASCHNNNPKLDGPVGPAIHGSSLELLEAKVIRGEYPEGYKPKRDTWMMPTFPTLDIKALEKFLNETK